MTSRLFLWVLGTIGRDHADPFGSDSRRYWLRRLSKGWEVSTEPPPPPGYDVRVTLGAG